MSDIIINAVKKIFPEKLHPQFKAFFLSLKKLRYFGRGKICPICRARLKAFLPYGLDNPVFDKYKVAGGGYRRDVFCPVCHSIDRERLLYLFLKTETSVFNRPIKLLHIAPEINLEPLFKNCRQLHYITADKYSSEVMEKMDITDIHFHDDSFDAVMCNHVLEHVVDDEKALSELFRVIIPGGWAVLQVPVSLALVKTFEDFSIVDPHEKETTFGQKDHVRIYAQDYKDRIARAGFKVTVYDWTQNADAFGGTGNKYGLNKQEKVYFAEKPRQ